MSPSSSLGRRARRAAVLLCLTLSSACSSDDAAPGADGAGGAGTTEDAGTPPDAGAGAILEKIQITAGDFVFDARVAGPEDGEPVFLLHGFPQTSYEWRRQLEALGRAGYRAIAPSQRGYSPGARPAAVSDYGVLQLAGDVVAMADAVGAQRFHLVGHDWGAGVAWAVAGLAPARVISLLAMSVPHPDAFAKLLADKSSCQYAASAYFDFFTTPEATDFFVNDDFAGLKAAYAGIAEEDVAVYLSELDRDAVDAGLNWYRANVANRTLNAPPLGAIQVPTVFVWSDGDTYLCREGADLTGQYVEADYRLEIITGVDHWIADKAPDQLNDILLAHVARHTEQ